MHASLTILGSFVEIDHRIGEAGALDIGHGEILYCTILNFGDDLRQFWPLIGAFSLLLRPPAQ